MRGYPKYIATKQDYINLLNISESFNALTDPPEGGGELPGKGGSLGPGALSPAERREQYSTLFQVRQDNSPELNEILDVCTAAATPDDFRGRVIAELAEIWNLPDDKAFRAISINPDGSSVTEEIDNPMPLWKVKGFGSRQEIADLIAQYDSGEV